MDSLYENEVSKLYFSIPLKIGSSQSINLIETQISSANQNQIEIN